MRDAVVRDAEHFGAVDLLGLLAANAPRALSAAWGRDAPSGTDAENAVGRILRTANRRRDGLGWA